MEANQNDTSDSIPSSQSSQPLASGEKKLRKPVTVDLSGILVGDNSGKFSTRAGELIRLHCLLSYKDWRLVPKNFKDDVWNALMSEFEFVDVPSELVRPNVEISWPQKFRTHKYNLRKNILKNATSQEVAESSCHNGYDPHIWKAFVAREAQDRVIEIRAKNAENRMKNTICHTLGRRSYANKSYIMEKKDGLVVDGREDPWMKGHEMSDGTVHPSAIEKYEKVKAAKEKRKQMSGEGSSNQVDFDSDVLAEVFGSDIGKWSVRGYSSHVSKKRAQQAALASSLFERRIEKHSGTLEVEVKKISSQMEFVTKTLMQHINTEGMTKACSEDATPASKVASNSAQHTSGVNLNQMFDDNVRNDTNVASKVFASRYVNLLDRNGNVVATGYIVTGKEGEVCHGRKVLPGERKVRIEEVHDVYAPVPDAPQGDDNFTLAGYVEGGWLIWIESRLQSIN